MPELSLITALIPLSPLLAALAIGLSWLYFDYRGEKGERLTARLSIVGISLSLVLSLYLSINSALLGETPGHLHLVQWISSGDFKVNLSFLLDTLSLTMMSVISLICLITIRFSVSYLHREPAFQRFFMVLSLFSSAMLLIVMGGNPVITFIGWELAGVSSYLLIGYALDRNNATGNANRAFVTNRIGDAGFVLGIFLTYYWLGDLDWLTLFDSADHLPTLVTGLLSLGFLLAALIKSAQVPFSPWITRALEGPTPSSAIFYGSLMVHAGVYLVIRLEPVITQAPLLMIAMMMIGLLTALYGYLNSLVQSDIKTALMFSTLGQVGLMFLACGLGWFEWASIHMVLHAIWRSYQFLHAPSQLQLMHKPMRPVSGWLARQPWLYTAVVNRFWLDSMSDWLLTKPSQSLAREAQRFDDRVIVPLVGLPARANAVTSLADWESQKRGFSRLAEGDVGHGQGVAGKLMESIASLLHWFEEHLVLKGGGEGLINTIHRIGSYLQTIEQLLSHPRYLLLLIMATFVVII